MSALQADTGFPPIVHAGARVLILGSMPGVKSLQAGEYYAHPRNAFWWIMGCLFGAGFDKSYPQRRRILMNRGIAVWDVIHRCRRSGSLDSAIQQHDLVVNDFATLLYEYTEIKTILLNGKSVETLFRRHVVNTGQCRLDGIALRTLPSTSPANARMTAESKLNIWRKALRDSRVNA